MECNHTRKVKRLRFFKGAAYKTKDKTAPRWRFHIELVCADCEKRICFIKQDGELVKELDKSILFKRKV